MENHSLQELVLQSGGPASQLAVVVVDNISPNISVSDLQDAVMGAGAQGWHLYYDPVLLKLTLKARFEDKDRAESYITMFNHLILENPPYEPKALDARLVHTLSNMRLSPTVASSTTGGAPTPNSTIADDLSETTSTAGRSSLYDAKESFGCSFQKLQDQVLDGTGSALSTTAGWVFEALCLEHTWDKTNGKGCGVRYNTTSRWNIFVSGAIQKEDISSLSTKATGARFTT
ncbi:hypothetical protein VSDG_08532 [Cytospora chrysosperma]|uniref:Uncharacterized protein n=1 Tax=Cytospora chrysosperma TaxID=252740 RepID=A0A423VEX3_CYTCH|nr:hypothetical protein VSDG_08532 [Valsa sordida]